MRPVLIACCGLMLALAAAAPAYAQYQVGDTIADFTLNDSNGAPVSLYDYEDMVVLLNFWQDG